MASQILQPDENGIMPCRQPQKKFWPERPECVHGPMYSNGNTWYCKDARVKRYSEHSREQQKLHARDRRYEQREQEIMQLIGEYNANS